MFVDCSIAETSSVEQMITRILTKLRVCNNCYMFVMLNYER
jgi:hypothetical protein